MKKFVLAICLIAAAINTRAADLILYAAPKDATAAPEFEVEVNGQKVFVYNTKSAAIAYFSFSGKVDIKVTFLSPVYNFDIRPKSRNIIGEASRNEIRFSLDNPANLSIEINKNIKRPLFIFANPLEEKIPDKTLSNVIFFEGGKTHTPGILTLKSNQVVYIAGGAVVKGSFKTDKGENIKIMGRGSRQHINPFESLMMLVIFGSLAPSLMLI